MWMEQTNRSRHLLHRACAFTYAVLPALVSHLVVLSHVQRRPRSTNPSLTLRSDLFPRSSVAGLPP